jgi:hypothetical protein
LPHGNLGRAIAAVCPARAPRGRRGRSERRARRRRDSTRFLADRLRGSRIELRDLNVYELDPDEVGEFDLVVMGYVLQTLRDPLVEQLLDRVGGLV